MMQHKNHNEVNIIKGHTYIHEQVHMKIMIQFWNQQPRRQPEQWPWNHRIPSPGGREIPSCFWLRVPGTIQFSNFFIFNFFFFTWWHTYIYIHTYWYVYTTHSTTTYNYILVHTMVYYNITYIHTTYIIQDPYDRNIF